jgi:DtxR family transcriptional regulator, Mn-dependent transcriptional regulator
MNANPNGPSDTQLSESEEMYLATIARIQEAGQPAPVPLSQLAGEMAVLSVSANQMVRKLEEAGLVTYTPYKGVDLTRSGQREAYRILRHRRLWEVFLVERLHYTPKDADQLACRLEHTLPSEAAERLSDFLGRPVESPQQQPIPAAQAEHPLIHAIPLNQLRLNQTARVIEIACDSAARSFLDLQGIRSGAKLCVLASAASGEMLVQSQAGRSVMLAGPLTQAIRVIVA